MAYDFRSGCLWLLLAAGTAGAGRDTDIGEVLHAQGVDPAAAAALVIRLADGREWLSNPRRVDERFSPASTSKIPHTLIALETGYADGPEFPFTWDGTERAFASWNQDQTLATAFRRSAVWVYQRIAQDLGGDVMRDWLVRFDYGNHAVGQPDDLTTYWLRGPLAISAREQAGFLARLARNELPLSARTLALARDIMLADEGRDWRLFAKTGWGVRDGASDIGWYVGWVERDDGETWVFALNMDMPGEAERSKRIPLARAMLDAVGAIDINEENGNAP